MFINREMDREDAVYVNNQILLSHKKEQNNAICSNKGGPRDCPSSEASQKERNEYHMLSSIPGV